MNKREKPQRTDSMYSNKIKLFGKRHWKKIQIAVLFLISFSLAGMFVSTDVYSEVNERIVSVLCLSCIKLQPKTVKEFTFKTANNVSHPQFILEYLSKNPVFVEYSEDVCQACDIMHPTIEQLFNISFEKQDTVNQTVRFHEFNITFIYINIDHTTEEMRRSLLIYDKEHVGGLPMFTLITLGYDQGIIRPYYTSLYGTLDLPTAEQRIALLTELINEGFSLYQQNKEGYLPDHH